MTSDGEKMQSESQDFRRVLDIEEGEEQEKFWSRLNLVLTQEGDPDDPINSERERISKRYGIEVPFPDSCLFEKFAESIEDSDELKIPPREEHEPFTIVGGNDDPFLRVDTGFPEFCDEKHGLKHFMWLHNLGVHDLYRLLLVETQHHGSVSVPRGWTVGGVGENIASPYWKVFYHHGLSYYIGQNSHFFRALRQYTHYLASVDEFADKAIETIAMSAMYLHDIGKYSAVIDGLMVLDDALLLHTPSKGSIIAQIVDWVHCSSSAGVRSAAADFHTRHPMKLLTKDVMQAALEETSHKAAKHQVVSLRLIGGSEGFDALAQVAADAKLQYCRKLAARALAWVENCDDKSKRIKKLCLSKTASARAAGASALSELKHSTVASMGNILASYKEKWIMDALKGLDPGNTSTEARGILAKMFEDGNLRLEKEETSAKGEEVQIITGGGTILFRESGRPERVVELIEALRG